MKSMIPEKRPGDNVRLNVAYPQEEEFALTNINPWNYYQFMYFPYDYKEYYDKYIRFKNISEKSLRKWKNDYQQMVKKAMINSGGEIPLLKNPCNTGRIKILLDIYPNAKFIFIIRNPILVFLSSKKFFAELLPTLWFHTMDEADMEEMIFNTYNMLIQDYQDIKAQIPSDNLIEIKFDEYEKAPLTFLKNLYQQFNISGFDKAEKVFTEYINSQSGYRKNKYIISQELLDRIRDRWGFSMDLWNYGIPENLEVK
jgi:hypothetical protein